MIDINFKEDGISSPACKVKTGNNKIEATLNLSYPEIKAVSQGTSSPKAKAAIFLLIGHSICQKETKKLKETTENLMNKIAIFK